VEQSIVILSSFPRLLGSLSILSVLMLLIWQELAGLLEKNQGITKLQLNSINVGDEVCFF